MQEPPERPDPDPQEDLGEFDYTDPLKRDEHLPGADPFVPPVPPES